MALQLNFFVDQDLWNQVAALQSRYAAVTKPPLDRAEWSRSEICRRALEAGLALMEVECLEAEGRAATASEVN